MSPRFACATEARRLVGPFTVVLLSFLSAWAIGTLFADAFGAWNNRVSDLLFTVRYRLLGRGEESPRLIHVVVDDASRQNLELAAGDRSVFIELLEVLRETGAKVIACDVLFAPGQDQDADRRLAEAARATAGLVLPVVVYDDRPGGEGDPGPDAGAKLLARTGSVDKAIPDGNRVMTPFAQLREAASALGHINCTPDSDGRVRRLPLLYRVRDAYVPSLALRAALGYLDVGDKDVEVRPGRYLALRNARPPGGVAADIVIPIDAQARMIVNITGPWEKSLRFPVHKLLAARDSPEQRRHLVDLMDGAVVVISDTSVASRDLAPGVFDRAYPMSALHVSVLNSILTRRFVRDQEPLDVLLTSIALVVLLSCCAARWGGVRLALAWALVLVLYAGFDAALFVHAAVLPRSLVPSLGFALSTLALAAAHGIRIGRERAVFAARLERETRIEDLNRELRAEKKKLELANARLVERLSAPRPRPGAPAANAGNGPPVELQRPEAFAEIVTCSPLMHSRFAQMESIAANGNPVLITGESGVGKELAARAIHRLSGRRGAFVAENIAGLDDTMIADALFGHARGAFTDAGAARNGLVDQARGGTLFLDEIGDLSVNSQVKLLRLIEEKEYRPLGADAASVCEARIIIATNASLEKKVREGAFREDLFYRLTHRIEIPPLRNRLEDLPLLVDLFLEKGAQALGRRRPAAPEGLVTLLGSYRFPGNVRELKNLIDNAVSRYASLLPLSFFEEYVRNADSPACRQGGDAALVDPDRIPTLKAAERELIARALARTGGNQNAAARMLGLSPSALSRRLGKPKGQRRARQP
jgi:DNA-binding NtrC family response regulator/CHASE2 domain-containing sensor protein